MVSINYSWVKIHFGSRVRGMGNFSSVVKIEWVKERERRNEGGETKKYKTKQKYKKKIKNTGTAW